MGDVPRARDPRLPDGHVPGRPVARGSPRLRRLHGEPVRRVDPAGAGRPAGRASGSCDASDPRSAMVPPLLLVGLLWTMLIGDIFTGGRLQIDTVFGYSPVVAGRFAGYGNLAFALLAISTVVLVHRSVGSGPDPGGAPDAYGSRRFGLALVIAIFLVAIVADGYPSFGERRRRRPRPRAGRRGRRAACCRAGGSTCAKLAIIASASVLVLAVFAGDRPDPPAAGPHPSRSARRVDRGERRRRPRHRPRPQDVGQPARPHVVGVHLDHPVGPAVPRLPHLAPARLHPQPHGVRARDPGLPLGRRSSSPCSGSRSTTRAWRSRR